MIPQQEVEDWIDANLEWFTKDDPLFTGNVARISTSNGAGTEPDVEFGIADYKKAKKIAGAAAKQFRRAAAVKATRDLATGEVGVEIDITGEE